MQTVELKEQLDALNAERALAGLTGLDGNARYMADLDGELAAARAAYLGAMATEIATLRAQLDGPLLG